MSPGRPAPPGVGASALRWVFVSRLMRLLSRATAARFFRGARFAFAMSRWYHVFNR
jgi:hypothetical protein